MPNENIMGIPTKACINGLTKEDTERLKNALIKKIINDDTIIDVTEDGKIVVSDNIGMYLIFDGNILGIRKDPSGDYIPETIPYLPEDENENPLVPPSGTIITSDNIAVDPRIVHTTGNETISGNKNIQNSVNHVFRKMDGYQGSGKYLHFLTIKNGQRFQIEVSLESFKAIGQASFDTVPYSFSEEKGSWYFIDPTNWLNGKNTQFFLLYKNNGDVEIWCYCVSAISIRINGIRQYGINIDPSNTNLVILNIFQDADPRLDTVTYPNVSNLTGRIIGGVQ